MPVPKYILFLITFLFFSATLTAQTTWTGNVSADWNVAGNWSAGVPDASDDVTINSGHANDPTITTAGAVARYVFLQSATLTVAVGGTLSINGASNYALQNQGTVQNNGTISIGATAAAGAYGVYNKGAFYNNAGGQLIIDQVGGTALVNNTGYTFTNTGTITIGATTTAGQFGIDNNGVFYNNTGGQINIDRTTENALNNAANSTFYNAAGITIGANATSGLRGILNSGTFNNNAGSQLRIDRISSSGINNTSYFTNVGAITIGANAATGTRGIENSANFTNSTGGQINIDRVTDIGLYNNTSTLFNNQGAITIGALSTGNTFNTGIYCLGNFLHSGGQIDIDRVSQAIYINTFQFDNAGTITAGASTNIASLLVCASGGIFNNNTGAVLKGSGSITASGYTNGGGLLAPGAPIGIITFDASKSFGASRLAMDINGPGVAGTNYDQLVVNGTATLSGTLTISINYTPTPGDQVKILSATAISGAFLTVTLPAGWEIQYQSNAVLLYYAANNSWTGAISTAWNDPGNWTVGVPAATANVVIPDVTNDPVISTNDVAVKSLTIQSGASLTISNTGILTINGATSQGLLNQGTVQNSGTIKAGSTSATGANAITNEAIFNNNTGGLLYLDRFTDAGLFNNGGTVTNVGAITIGANAAGGLSGINNSGTFNNNAGGQLIIDQVTTAAISNPGGYIFTNAGAITIGSTAATGQYGISNSGSFSNNAGGQISIDRVSTTALNIPVGVSSFTNTGTITIGAIAAAGAYGISNYGVFNNTAGQISIDQTTTAALYNYTGNFTNAATLIIGANAASGQYGIQDNGTFKNNAGSQLRIDRVTTAAIYHSYDVFTNAGTITIGANATAGAVGINAAGVFYNNTGGQINIDRVTTAITVTSVYNNAGTITIGALANIATLLTGTSAGSFNNNTGGIFKGAGSIAATPFVNNGGTLSPGQPVGAITFDAAETFTSHTLAIDVNGSGTAGTNYDQLVVNGAATLGGTLAVTINYTPVPDDQLTILSATAVSGTFATVTGLPANWQVVYKSNAVVLVYTAATTWTGAVNTAWNNAGNWTAGVPGASTLATIPDVTNDPVISTTDAVVRTVTIQTGGLLTINSTGILSINSATQGLQNQSIYNQGTLQNNGAINVGNISGTGANAIVNEATFNNNTGAQIYIDRFTGSGLFNSGGTITNVGTITIGANATGGPNGIVNQGTFYNNTGGRLFIDRVTTSALANPAGNTVTNTGTITIGGTATTGQYGINNSGTINNNAGGVINADRATIAAISNTYGSAFTNAGNIAIGANAAMTGLGMLNVGTTTNSSTGRIVIDQTQGGFSNSTGNGKLINTGTVTIGATGSVGNYGFNNYGTLTNTGGQISIDRATSMALVNPSGGTLTNTGVINIGANAATGTEGINNSGSFNNNAGGQFTIDRVTNIGIHNIDGFTIFNNQGIISIGALSGGNTINYGIYIEKNGSNLTGGQINIDRVNTAIATYLNTFSNAGTISIGASTSVSTLLSSTGTGTFSNNAGGILKGASSVSAARYVNNGGTLAPGVPIGAIAFDAAETFTSNTLAIEIKGAGTPGTDFDQVTVNGAATLGGDLTIATINGFTLQAGQSYIILTAGAVTGTFASVTLPTGVTGTVTYSATTATLNILSALPLTLVDFTGQAAGNKTLLKWQSANEENTASFTIERSANGSNFTTIGTVAAMGSGAHNYSFTDNTPLTGNNYYRLKMTDLNGSFTYSSLVAVKFDSKGSVQIAPVPADNYVTLTIHDQSLIGQSAPIYNTAGVAITTVVLSGSTRINITGWPAGSYYIKTAIGTFRFIKQ